MKISKISPTFNFFAKIENKNNSPFVFVLFVCLFVLLSVSL